MAEDSRCMLCPRQCGARRSVSRGVCGCLDELKVARAALHMWEEPCISGEKGSGAIFFSGCPLHCIFCQNRAISDGLAGKVITIERLTEICLSLQEQGAANINLVTAGQYARQIVTAIRAAKAQGLTIPVICNSGGYETVETVMLLSEVVDVWLPDLKYLHAETAKRYSNAPDYPLAAKRAIDCMIEHAGPLSFDAAGYIKSGVIVRHLVLPGHAEEAMEIVDYLHKTYGERIYISIMNQYTPPKEALPYKELNRKLTRYEYDKVVRHAIDLGIEQAYVQERGTVGESFIPAFDCEGV